MKLFAWELALRVPDVLLEPCELTHAFEERIRIARHAIPQDRFQFVARLALVFCRRNTQVFRSIQHDHPPLFYALETLAVNPKLSPMRTRAVIRNRHRRGDGKHRANTMPTLER